MVPLGLTNCGQQINLLSKNRSIHQCHYLLSWSFNATSTEHYEDFSHWQELQVRAKGVKFCISNSAKLSKTQETSVLQSKRVIGWMTQNETLPFSKRSNMYDLEPINQWTNAIQMCSKSNSCFVTITSMVKFYPPCFL